MKQADAVDFEIFGSEMQFLEVELDPGESAVGQAGAMVYMDQGIAMESVFGDGSGKQPGVLGSLLSAGKRLLAGESLFMTVYSNEAGTKKKVAFAASYPGKIIPISLQELGGEVIVQKQAFLAAAKGVAIEIFFQKKLGVGFFGGEGFIMEKISGDGLCFVHAGGTIIEKVLSPEEIIVVDSGCVVGFRPTVTMEIRTQSSLKTALFSGESVFLTELKGPGKIWIQSLPFSRLADTISAAVEERIMPKIQSLSRG